MKTLKQEVERIIDFVDILETDSEKTAMIKAEIVNRGTDFIDDIFKEILEEIDEGIKLTIKLYPHKKGEELAGEIFEYLSKILKEKGDLEK